MDRLQRRGAPQELKAYGKVFLKPGETRMLTMQAALADLAAWDPATKRWTLAPVEYIFHAGGASRHLSLQAPLTL